jgi:EAL domain-containing protein (putative c-di-GMP-specific phosphodiesterase class I)
VLHYQPKVDLKNGVLVGAEALIRWNDPGTGLVPPGDFIPILEETGLIFEVGKWALNKAIEDYLRWSMPDCRRCAWRSMCRRCSCGSAPLSRSRVRDRRGCARAGRLELEITESLIMEDVNHSIASLQAIRAMGVEIAIDDFGTGFSSLSYLARLPIDTLKIDRSFIVAMTSGSQGVALVSAIINVGQSLKLNVVAEGVETEEQSRLLRLLKCNQAQGFLFSKALPAGQFAARVPGRAPVQRERAAFACGRGSGCYRSSNRRGSATAAPSIGQGVHAAPAPVADVAETWPGPHQLLDFTGRHRATEEMPLRRIEARGAGEFQHRPGFNALGADGSCSVWARSAMARTISCASRSRGTSAIRERSTLISEYGMR